MKLSDGKRNHSVKRNSDPSSSGSHFCSGHKRFPPPYTCLIKSANQNNVNSTWGLQMLPKGDGGLKNPQTFPEDVNDMNLFSIQNFLSCSPENNKVTKKKKKSKEVWLLQKKQKTNNTRLSIYLKSQLCYTIVNGLCSLLSSRTKLELRRSYSEESVQLFLGTKAGRRQQRSR